MYNTENVEFLIDEQDTVEFYEAKGKERKQPSHNDQLMMALSSLDHVQKVEAIHGMYFKLTTQKKINWQLLKLIMIIALCNNHLLGYVLLKYYTLIEK